MLEKKYNVRIAKNFLCIYFLKNMSCCYRIECSKNVNFQKNIYNSNFSPTHCKYYLGNRLENKLF